MKIRAMHIDDMPGVLAIYREGISTGIATFEKEIPSAENWDSGHLKSCRIVACEENTIMGWAALSPVSGRCIYGGVAEVSIYIGKTFRGAGIGKILMDRLIDESEVQGIWTLQSGVFPENAASIHLHEHAGFRLIGKRVKIARLDGIWRDNLLFEKRSTRVGID